MFVKDDTEGAEPSLRAFGSLLIESVCWLASGYLQPLPLVVVPPHPVAMYGLPGALPVLVLAVWAFRGVHILKLLTVTLCLG